MIMSRVDVSEDVSLIPVRRVLWKRSHARREKSCGRGLMHGGKSPVEEVSCTAGKVLWKRSHARREKSCGRGLMHGGERFVAGVLGMVRKVLWKRSHARREKSYRRYV